MGRNPAARACSLDTFGGSSELCAEVLVFMDVS